MIAVDPIPVLREFCKDNFVIYAIKESKHRGYPVERVIREIKRQAKVTALGVIPVDLSVAMIKELEHPEAKIFLQAMMDL